VIPANPSPGKRNQPTKKNKEKKVVEEEEIEINTDKIWRETFESNLGIDFNDPIIQENFSSIATNISEKIKQTRQDNAIMKKIYSSSVGRGMKEAMKKYKEQKHQVKHIKRTIRKI
jgi:hypothetical protein